jgi:hypothetical protein
MRKNDNKNRNRKRTIKLNLLTLLDYRRFKLRENRKGVFNNDRTIIKLTYALNNDNN